MGYAQGFCPADTERWGDPNEAELRLDIHGGSRIQLFGADNPDALRGQAFNGVVLDEYGDMTPKLFGAVVRPALSDRRGYAVIVGTIKGMSRRWPIHHGSRPFGGLPKRA